MDLAENSRVGLLSLGDLITARLAERQMTIEGFASACRLPRHEVIGLIDGTLHLDTATAWKVGLAIEINPAVLANLDKNWRSRGGAGPQSPM
jgi:plasmid maintenance system antidote protein VapI